MCHKYSKVKIIRCWINVRTCENFINASILNFSLIGNLNSRDCLQRYVWWDSLSFTEGSTCICLQVSSSTYVICLIFLICRCKKDQSLSKTDQLFNSSSGNLLAIWSHICWMKVIIDFVFTTVFKVYLHQRYIFPNIVYTQILMMCHTMLLW